MENPEMCACGRPLHYSDPLTYKIVSRFCRELGDDMPVTTPDGSWLVPRHYIALHGLLECQLPELAKLYQWEKIR